MALKLPSRAEPLKIGTRGSPLALAQAEEARHRLMTAFDLPEAAFTVVVISVSGDQVQDKPLKDLGGKGLFTREIEDDLLSGAVDLAVHSMKDMPVLQPDGLVLECYLPREDCRDALVSLDGRDFDGLDNFDGLDIGAVVGTSSIRRRAQILHRRPDLRVVEFRGNVQTRLRKLGEDVANATFLAMAGLNRLGLAQVPRAAMSPDAMLPAIAQGAIGIEQRADDARVSEMLAAIHHVPTSQQLVAERGFLAALDGSCQTPIAGLAEIAGSQIRLRGEILRSDGSEVLGDDRSAPLQDAAELGCNMAEGLLKRAGAGFFDWR